MKIRLVKLTPEFLIERLQGRPSPSSSNLPSNTELLDIKYDSFTRQVLAIVRSDSFEETKETYPVPEFPLKFSSSSKASPNVASTTTQTNEKIALTTNDKKEPVYPTRTHSSTKPDTQMIEEEFSQEQRKLLSFSTNQGWVIVKPVKFLKAEWDDINEIARSLGGRWVKGDIISYWEIPSAQK